MTSVATFAPRPLSRPTGTAEVPDGFTLAEMVAWSVTQGHMTLTEARSANLVISLHGHEVLRENWHKVRPKPGALILVRMRPMGGGGSGKKNPLRTILQLLVVVAVAWISGGFGVGGITALGGLFAAGSTSAMILGAVASVALNALVNAIAPIPQPEQRSRSESYTLTGARNSADPYGPCLITLGPHRVTGRLAARYFTKVFGDSILMYMLVQWHVGKCTLADLKIGDTPVSEYADVTIAHRLMGESYASTLGTVIGNLVFENPDIQIELLAADGWQTRRFPAPATQLSFDIAFPGGLNTSDGGIGNRSVTFEVGYRKLSEAYLGDVSWVPVPTSASVHMVSPGVLTITAATLNAIRRMIEWVTYDAVSGPDDYEMRIRRTTADTASTKVADEAYWLCVRAERTGEAIADDSICATALVIRANRQLNGVIDDLNAIITPVVPTWDGTDWETEAASSNPAALNRWLHTGQAIAPAKRLTAARLEAGAYENWYEYCETKALSCAAVIDYAASIEEVSQLTAACGYASSAWAGGKRTAIIDDEKLPVQVFTSETVRGFKERIVYLDPVHALRVAFLNAAAGYKPDEVIVYADGYDITTATLFQSAEAPGKTNAIEAWRMGQRLLKRAKIRRIGTEFEIDTESLVSRYGDRVLVEHFALQERSQSARVVEVLMDGPDVIGVRLDELVTMEDGVTYGLLIRRGADGALPLFDVDNPATGGGDVTIDEIWFDGAVDAGDAPVVGDLAVWGEAGKMMVDRQIINLTPGDDDFTASVVAVPYDDELFSQDGVTPVLPASILQAGVAGRRSVGAGTQSGDLNPSLPQLALQAQQAAIIQENDLLQQQIDQSMGVMRRLQDGTPRRLQDGTIRRLQA